MSEQQASKMDTVPPTISPRLRFALIGGVATAVAFLLDAYARDRAYFFVFVSILAIEAAGIFLIVESILPGYSPRPKITKRVTFAMPILACIACLLALFG